MVFKTEADGSLFAQVKIPESVPDGFHVLHVYGTDSTGQSVDIYKTVYIAENFSDIDGNGTPDDQQTCIGLEPVGRDIDQDGVDDSCDGFISQPPQSGQVGTTLSDKPDLPIIITDDNSGKSMQHTTDSPQTLAASSENLAAPKSAISNPIQNLRLPMGYLIGFGAFLTAAIALAFFTKEIRKTPGFHTPPAFVQASLRLASI